MGDLEPFFSEIDSEIESEIDDERLPLRCRAGSLGYLLAKESFFTEEQKRLVDAARDPLHAAIERLAEGPTSDGPEEKPEETQGTLF